MKLQPVTEERRVSYPESKAKAVKIMGRWIRRVGIAVALTSSAGFWSACTTIGGDVAGPEYYYTCEENDPAPAPDFLYPGTFSRLLCPGQSSWAELTIEDQQTLTFELVDRSYSSASNLHVVITGPDGAAAGSLDAENTFIELDLAPGMWRVTATQLSDTAEGEFDLHIGG